VNLIGPTSASRKTILPSSTLLVSIDVQPRQTVGHLTFQSA
jgi:hypothetical protein